MGYIQFMRPQRVRHHWLTEHTYFHKDSFCQKLVIICFSNWFSSVAQSCPTLCDPMDCSMPGFPVHHQLPELAQTHVHWVGDAIPPSHPPSSPLLLPPVSPSIRVFSSEAVCCIMWPKCWSFSFSISPSNEHPGLSPLEWTGWISLQSKGLSRVFSNTTVQKRQFFGAQLSLWSD